MKDILLNITEVYDLSEMITLIGYEKEEHIYLKNLEEWGIFPQVL